MRAIFLALSFIKVPRLFLFLLFWPLFFGLLVALAQVILTMGYVRIINRTADQVRYQIQEEKQDNWLLDYLHGSRDPLPAIEVCRWTGSGQDLQPDSPKCVLEQFDITIRSNDPLNFDADEYVRIFNGAAKRIHICETCRTDVLISGDLDDRTSDFFSISAIGVYMLRDMFDQESSRRVLDAYEYRERINALQGRILLHPAGFDRPVNLSEAENIMTVVLNISLLIVVTMWLALRAHRKVLDYFARSNALLPLVATCGKSTFYNALWFITALRVVFFLLASVPVTFFFFRQFLREQTQELLFGDKIQFALWLIAIAASLCAVTVVASIGELKHRHSWISFIYRYLPITCFVVGTLCWGATVFLPGDISRTVQSAVAIMPIFGVTPVILAPFAEVGSYLLAFHGVLSGVLVFLTLKYNARWFAAHLEEL